jgi:aconitase A
MALHPHQSSELIAVRLRVHTPAEAEYYRHGDVRNFVLRQLASS